MSKQSYAILAETFTATGTLVADRFVTALGAQTGADGNSAGVVRQSAVTGDLVTVDTVGTTIVETGAAVTKGATIKSDSLGRAIPWATSGARIAVARQAATAAGQFIEVKLIDNAA